MILVFKKGNIPHNLGKKHSKETRKKISKHHLKYYADATKNPMYGKHHSGLSKLRNRRSHLGKKASDKTKRKMSESRKGEKNAFFGKTHSEEMKQKLRLSLKKRLEENPALRELLSLRAKQRTGSKNSFFGKSHSEDTKQKLRLSANKRFEENPALRELLSKQAIERMADPERRKLQREIRAKIVIPRKDTTGEKILQVLCKTAGIQFLKHKNFDLGFQHHQVDLFIKPNICLEVDGDYWHANPNDHKRQGRIHAGFKPEHPLPSSKNKKITAKDKWKLDKKVTRALVSQDNIVIRFWQSELEENPEKCIQKIIKAIK